jgi:hypothetical protein
MEHLEGGSHGSLWHLVMTQRVNAGEALELTQDRFEKCWAKFIRVFRRLGMVAGLRTTHCVWSRHGGWHYHAHFFCEAPDDAGEAEMDVESLRLAWCKVRDEADGVAGDPGFMRLVAREGTGVPKDEASQGEFWSEPADAVACAVQYVVRDVCQSLEAWNLDNALDQITEFVQMAAGSHFSRMYGEWRVPAAERYGVVETVEEEKSNEVKAFKEGWELVGTVDGLIVAAREGQRHAKEVMRWLRQTLAPKSVVGSRLQRELNWLTR